MNARTLGSGYMLQQFRDFYGEVLRQKGYVQSPAPSGRPEDGGRAPMLLGGTDTNGGNGQSAYGRPGGGYAEEASPSAVRAGMVSQTLVRWIEQQALTTERLYGSYGAGVFREIMYVMAALADEVFLHLVEWDGRQAWRQHMLEARLFNSEIAGEMFFQKLERILSSQDTHLTELAAIYYLALALGFRGQYRGMDDGGRLANYRLRLFQLVMRRNPQLMSGNTPLFEESYTRTALEGPSRRFPEFRSWLVVGAAVLVGYVLVSHLLWDNAVHPVREIVTRGF
jgi:type VI secretion system protein ImpK